MVISAEEFEAFESIAHECTADYYEFLLYNNRDDAIERLFKRSFWGEATSPRLTENDMPNINRLLNNMDEALKNRAHTIKIELEGHDADGTYAQMMRLIGN